MDNNTKTASSVSNFKKIWEQVKGFFRPNVSSQYIQLEYYFELTRIQRNAKQNNPK